ncbi:MAG: hypothetical protein WDN76_00770 [Alphaproteobacteria bacterium]
MEKLISQMQAVLTVVSTVLPLTPAKHRATLASALDAIAAALQLGGLAAASAEDLAAKFAALRAEAESMARVGEAEWKRRLSASGRRHWRFAPLLPSRLALDGLCRLASVRARP